MDTGVYENGYIMVRPDDPAIAAAVAGAVPKASTTTPPPTALDSVQGNANTYARADHTHAARVQRVTMMTDASGNATFVFARPIICPKDKLPPISYMVEDAGSPVVVQITSRAFTNDPTPQPGYPAGIDTHTAVTVKAQRSRALPATILAVGALAGYDQFAGTAAAVRINLFAADPTQ